MNKNFLVSVLIYIAIISFINKSYGCSDIPVANMDIILGIDDPTTGVTYVQAEETVYLKASSWSGEDWSGCPEYNNQYCSYDRDTFVECRNRFWPPWWMNEIKRWQWDFDGDGNWDYTEDCINQDEPGDAEYDKDYFNGATTVVFSPPDTYEVKLKVTDDDYYESCGDYGDKSATKTFTVVAVDVDIIIETATLAVNDDDDDEDGVKDSCDDINPQEDDLVEISISIEPDGLPGKVGFGVGPELYSGCVKVWSHPDKQNQILPTNEGSYVTEFSASALPKTMYVEGISHTPQGAVIIDTVYRPMKGKNLDHEYIQISIVDVEMYMENVIDGCITEELFPGGFISLNDDDDNNNEIPDKDESGPITDEDDLVKLTLEKVQPETVTGPITLQATGGSKIKIWESETKGGSPITLPKTYSTPTDLPTELWIEGVDTSSTVRDIELVFDYSGHPFDDKIKMTVLQVDIDMDGVSDNKETAKGGFIALNDDDDDDNENADNNENGPITNEDNLIKITLQKVKPIELTGDVVLKDDPKINIWESATKGGTAITLPKTYSTPSDLPKELYVEGFTASSSVRDITLTLEYSVAGETFHDKVKVTAIDVESIAVDTSDSDSHKILSVKPPSKVPDDHFVTVKGITGNIVLKATINPNTEETRDTITWTAMSQDPSDKLKATKSRATSGNFPATVNVNGRDARDLTNWVVWANLEGNVQNPVVKSLMHLGLRVGTTVHAHYNCTASIDPSSMFDTTKDIPNLQGNKSSDPPGGTNVCGTSLAGGATLKWDISRRISRQINVTAANPALTLSCLDQNISFPADARVGNDDTSTGDENNDPYSNPSLLTSVDTPTRTFGLQGGNVGQTYENLTNFQEFARLNLDSTWYTISVPEAWSVQFRFIKTQVTEALWNVDANGDGDKLDNITEAMLGIDTNGDGDQADAVGYWADNGSTSGN